MMTEPRHLDEEALAELQDVMENEFDVLIQTYVSDSRARVATLREALAAGDATTFAKTAHSFKGSCINIGAPRLGELCQAAEAAGRAGDMEQGEELLGEIETELERVVGLLEDLSQH